MLKEECECEIDELTENREEFGPPLAEILDVIEQEFELDVANSPPAKRTCFMDSVADLVQEQQSL